MKAPAFRYCRPESTHDVLSLLSRGTSDGGSDARILAGGQSLMAALNLRLSAPGLLIDINRIDELKGIALTDDSTSVTIRALARHVEVATSPIVRDHLPLVWMAMDHVAHPAVRNRGTTCGSLALADPSAEMPACAVALGATLVLHSAASGIREVPAEEFFFGLYETARREDELLVAVRFPCAQPLQRFGFDELSRRHGDFAMVGVAVRAHVVDAVISDLRLVVFGTDPAPVVSTCAPGLAEGQRWSPDLGAEIAAQTVLALEPDDNMFGTPDIRRRQAATLIRRVLASTFTD